MIISHKKRFIFFACGKTGTTSIEEILASYHDDKKITEKTGKRLEELRKQYGRPFNPKHVRPSLIREMAGESIWSTYFKIAFVRNPWDWVLSNFYFNFRYMGRYISRFDTDHVNAVYHFMALHNQTVETESYFQHPFVFDRDGGKLVDYVGRFENLQNDFNKMCKIIQVKPSILPVTNSSHHGHYKELYTQQAKELVARYYADDISLLDYTF